VTLQSALLQVVHNVRRRSEGELSLAAIAEFAGWSPFHLSRTFRRVVGETPKQYLLRLRLESAAARLLASDARVIDIALAAGFESHEVFGRAFRRRFGRTPTQYRAAAALRGASDAERVRHLEVVDSTGPCIGFFHLPTPPTARRTWMPTESIVRKEITAQPVLFVRLRAARNELPAAIAEGAGKSYVHAQKAGAALAGKPFTRYLTSGPGLLSIEVGLPVVSQVAGAADVESGSLPAGLVAVATHAGPYEELASTYAALERWIESQQLETVGAPWESYVTDPAEHPNPADWRTEVYWPIAE
jgi:AraC family transcriptional regulator